MGNVIINNNYTASDISSADLEAIENAAANAQIAQSAASEAQYYAQVAQNAALQQFTIRKWSNENVE